jgi:23S rRNA pseudouridine1911/1915/1917 synthase
MDSTADKADKNMPPFTASLIVERELSGVRIDSFLVRHFRNYTSWRMQRIVRAGGATIDCALAWETDRVFKGQTITVRLLEPPDKLLEPDARPVEIQYSDPWLAVVNKPPDIVTHPTGDFQTGTLANAMQHWLDRGTAFPGLLRPGLVHRLDRETSGTMVVALHHLSHRRLSAAFEAGRVAKTYLAIVQGRMECDAGLINQPIGRARAGSRVLMSARADATERKIARTRYEVLERFAEHTFVRARPLTGRNHQIRVHFAHIGHPLVGDEFYEAHGGIKATRPRETPRMAAPMPIQRHALHAESLAFAHPMTDLWLQFRTDPPDEFRRTLEFLRHAETPTMC